MSYPVYGRYAVAESPSMLACLHQYDGTTPLKVVDHEPKVGVLDQSDLIAQIAGPVGKAGTTGARDILPNVAQVMAFMGSAGMVFASIVHRPIVQYPARPVIHAAYDEMEPAVEHDIESATHQVIIKHGGT